MLKGLRDSGFGRSRGDFTTKLYLLVKAHGLPMRAEITSGQTSDYLGFDLVMADNLPQPSVLPADRGYKADSIRNTMDATNPPHAEITQERCRFRPAALSSSQFGRAMLQQIEEYPPRRDPF